MSPRKNKHQRAAEAAAAFNQKHPQGTPVLFWPGIRQETPLKSRTRGEAWVLPSGEAVVRVEGRAGGIALSHIEVIAVAGSITATFTEPKPTSIHLDAQEQGTIMSESSEFTGTTSIRSKLKRSLRRLSERISHETPIEEIVREIEILNERAHRYHEQVTREDSTTDRVTA